MSLAISKSFWGKCLFRSPSHFSIGLFVFLVLISMSSLQNLDISCLPGVIGKYILSFNLLSFYFIDYFLCCAKLSSLMQSHLFIFFFCSPCLRRYTRKKNCYQKCQRCYSLCFLLGFLWF